MKIVKTIFIADDDEDDRMLIREAVESVMTDVEILEVTDGKDLIDLMEREKQKSEECLILMDVNMPRMSGLEALEVVKSNPAYQHIPVIIFSTSAYPDQVKRAYDLGANAYITKPISTTEYLNIARAVNTWFLNHYAPV